MAHPTATVQGSRAHWITPNEQLKRLAAPVAEKVAEASGLIPPLAAMVAEYAPDPKLTHWYTALERIGQVPERIPPLPGHIHEILSKPFRKLDGSFSLKPDGTTPYTVGEKCVLYLVPEGTLNESIRSVRAYGENHSPMDANPFQFRVFVNELLRQQGDVSFRPLHWVLYTDDVLEGSRNKFYQEQAVLVASLAQKTHVDWQVPNLHDTIATIFLHKIATGEILYQAGNNQNSYRHTYTHVKDTVDDCQLVVGGFDPIIGLNVIHPLIFPDVSAGIAVQRTFY